MKFSFCLPLILGTITCPAATFFFEAQLTADQIVGGTLPDSTATGTATFTLTTGGTGGPELAYDIRLNGLTILSTPASNFGGPDQEVNAIHLHFGAFGSNGRHALNIFRSPREDDADLLIFPDENRVTGIYDNSDQNFGGDNIRQPFDSIALSDTVDPAVDPSDPTFDGSLDALLAGELYLQVHTFGFNDGEIRGQIVPVPEPSAILFLLMSSLVVCRRKRHPGALD